MVPDEIVHIAIGPPDNLEGNLIKQVATIIDKDLHNTRLLLSGKVPKIIAHYNTIQAAESIASRLKALNLVVIVCRDSEIRKASQRYRAQTLNFEEHAILFRDSGGYARRIESKDVFLIIHGRMQTHIETEVTKSKRKLNLVATVLTGGIPIRRRVEERTMDRTLQTEYFIRLYARTSPEPDVEILQHSLDYSFLGAKMVASSLVNFGTTVTKIRGVFPQAIFDDRLTEPFSADLPSMLSQESIEIKCKLIYLYHRAVSAID